jgi:cytochrome c oxidase assembly protein subunit 15
LLLWVSRHRAVRDLRLGRFALLLAAAIAIQVFLGGATWIVKFGWPWLVGDWPAASRYLIVEKSFLQMNVVTAHVATGSLILAILTVMVCRAARAWQVLNAAPAPRFGESPAIRTVQAGS